MSGKPGGHKRARRSGARPDGPEDAFVALSQQYWAKTAASRKPFDAKVVSEVYTELKGAKFPPGRVALLEYSHYLEEFLWPAFDHAASTLDHLLSIVLLVNEKFLNQTDAWTSMVAQPEHFPGLMHRLLDIALATGEAEGLSMRESTMVTVFLVRCFQSMEHDLLRTQLIPLVGLNTWACLLPGRFEAEMQEHPKLRKGWKKVQKIRAKKSAAEQAIGAKQDTFLFDLARRFLGVVASNPTDRDSIAFCERCLELMIDVQALLTSRRYINAVLDTAHVVELCSLSLIGMQTDDSKTHLFRQLLDILKFYSGFEIQNFTGEPLTDNEMTELHYSKMTALQKVAFQHFPKLKPLALANVSSIDTRQSLEKHFLKLSEDELHDLCQHMSILEPRGEAATEHGREFLVELLTFRFERRLSQLEALNEMPLFPTEQILWDENIVPSEFYADGCLALPKLNIQFLTLFDYLLRNLNLFNMESTYEIRQDIENTLPRLRAYRNEHGGTDFSGWARMAHPIKSFLVVEVAKPNVGEKKPSSVRADVTLNLDMRPHLRQEWEGLRRHDVGLLITIMAPGPQTGVVDQELPFCQKHGIVTVRGCEVEGMLDVNGQLIDRFPGAKPTLPKSNDRTFRVKLDTNQYQMDLLASSQGYVDIYETFNIFMRRNPKENNFKAVLETIRELMNTQCVVPEWLHDIFLGYGNPGAAHYAAMDSQIAVQDWNDTFLDYDHLEASFPGYKLKAAEGEAVEPPFQLTFPVKRAASGLVPRNVKGKAPPPAEPEKVIVVKPYKHKNIGPYPANRRRQNTIPFTPTQVEAIRAGMQPGLTMVVGPPGTGKTDVAVQIISNLYHNYPTQRTLIVTHSNQALNQLFEKIMCLDIEERHLLRLGRGEEALQTDKSFSSFGRVDHVLKERLELLGEVQRLASSSFPEVVGDVASTCETAGHFFLYHVLAKWEHYTSKMSAFEGESAERLAAIWGEFPFTYFFANAPQPLFKGASCAADADIAQGCMHHIESMFERLNQYRPLELLHKQKVRSKYLMTKEAKIIAMTCTHAALTRHDLVKQGFKYDNIVMEESAQILEIETFIPLMLQNPEDGYSRLKRVVLIGDHHQLPPVIKNMAFKKFSNMEQSLFTRFVRLGVPTVDLDAQGRARPSIAKLYAWRYNNLGDLSHTQQLPMFTRANGGLQFDYQFVDVQDFEGRGEMTPEPFFYQNLGEAEYVVALFMYMRLQGYPAERITILTTYNGQKALIRDVINARCLGNPLFGAPAQIDTVDKFQGSQNDFVLLSLVRTKAVGHIRDVRRLVVAVSRARLGLYVFGRRSLFEECHELKPVFDTLLSRPDKLALYPDEGFGTAREQADTAAKAAVMADMPQMAALVYELATQRLSQAPPHPTDAIMSGAPPGMEDAGISSDAPPGFPGFGDDDDDNDDEAEAEAEGAEGAEVEKTTAAAPAMETEEDAPAPAAAAAAEAASTGPLKFDFVDVELEKAILTNTGAEAVSLAGFTIEDYDGGNASAPLADGISVPAGKSVTVWTAPGMVKGLKEDEDNVFWYNAGNRKPRSRNTLNDEGDGLRLRDSSGAVVASCAGQRSLHLVFESVDVKAEKAVLTNTGKATVSLAGFTLEDLDGGNTSAPLADSISVPAGKSVTVWTAPGTVKGLKESAENVFWCNSGNGKPRRTNVLNDEGDGLRLRNPAGQVVALGLGPKKGAVEKAAAAESGTATPGRSRKRKADAVEPEPAAAEEAAGEAAEAESVGHKSKKAATEPAQDWSKLTVAKLKKELDERGIGHKGLKRKAQFVELLTKATS